MIGPSPTRYASLPRTPPCRRPILLPFPLPPPTQWPGAQPAALRSASARHIVHPRGRIAVRTGTHAHLRRRRRRYVAERAGALRPPHGASPGAVRSLFAPPNAWRLTLALHRPAAGRCAVPAPAGSRRSAPNLAAGDPCHGRGPFSFRVWPPKGAEQVPRHGRSRHSLSILLLGTPHDATTARAHRRLPHHGEHCPTQAAPSNHRRCHQGRLAGHPPSRLACDRTGPTAGRATSPAPPPRQTLLFLFQVQAQLSCRGFLHRGVSTQITLPRIEDARPLRAGPGIHLPPFQVILAPGTEDNLGRMAYRRAPLNAAFPLTKPLWLGSPRHARS
jgi:hypothetical protein